MSPPKIRYIERIVAIILCAGKGTRITNLFPSTPKSLIKIRAFNDISILDHLLNNLLDLGIDLVEVIIGHLGSQIEEHIRLLKNTNQNIFRNVNVIDSGQEYQKGSFFSFLSFCKNSDKYTPKDLFLVFPGDTIFSKRLLESIFYLISKKDDSFSKYPSIFYQDVLINDLNQTCQQHLISILETFSKNNETFLKNVSQIDISNEHIDRIKKVVPIVTFPHKLVAKILNKSKSMNITSIKELINSLIKRDGQKFLVYELNAKYRFYDIDSEIDLVNFKKKSGQ